MNCPTRPAPALAGPVALLLALCAVSPVAGEIDATRERFLMEGGRKVHVLLRERGAQARLLLVFPAGNLAAALWMSAGGDVAPKLRLVEAKLVGGETERRWGAQVRVETDTGPLRVDRALFHSIRTVRGFTEGYPHADQEKVDRIIEQLDDLPANAIKMLETRALGQEAFAAWGKRLPLPAPAPAAPGTLIYARPVLGSAKRLQMVILPRQAAGVSTTSASSPPSGTTTATLAPQIAAGPGASFLVTATVEEEPAKPIAPGEILSPVAKVKLAALEEKDPALHAEAKRALDGLSFLSSEDALLAGSWRFLTYFGRDTLLFCMLMGSRLSARMWGAALGAVLRRVSDDGRVAHEESVGEYGALEKLVRFLEVREKDADAARSILSELERGDLSRHDYHMVDTELLVPLALARMAEAYPDAARSLVQAHRGKVGKNLTLVTSLARGPVTRRSEPWPAGLISLREGLDAGDWRDSSEGLGRGRYPASVNATLMPAALEAMAVLGADPELGLSAVLPPAEEIAILREEWKKVHDRFVFEYTDAEIGISSKYLEENQLAVSVPAGESGAMKALALSLDAAGKPVRVLHGDGLFLLLAPRAPPVDLEPAIGPLTRPFPRGLSTPAGPLVASAVTAPEVQPIFRRGNYHGLVIWSWPMVLARQAVGRLRQWDQQQLATRLEEQVKTWGPPRLEPEELWSVKARDGGLVRTSFGESLDDVTESNSLQLWSLASLAALIGE